MTINDPPDNVFIRFKNHIDNNIHRGFHTIFSSPTAIDAPTQDNDNTPANITRSVANRSDGENRSSGSGISRPDDGGQAGAQAEDVNSWALKSPYSPLNLQSLPQPRPNDAPPNYRDCFTFRDAFEDLLAVSTGGPLSDLRRLLHAKHHEHMRYFPFGMPVGDWVTNLGRRGLWGAYFPLSSMATHQLSYGRISPWMILPMNETTFHPPPQVLARSWFMFPSWEGHLPWDHRGWTEYEHEEAPLKRGAETTQPQEADSEGDLYAATQSDYAVDDRAKANTPREQNTQVGSTRSAHSQVSPENPDETPVTQTIETPDGGKIVKTVERHSLAGGTEVITVAERFDADGNLISTEKETKRTWSTESPGIFSSFSHVKFSGSDIETTGGKTDAKSTTEKDRKTGGWFWGW